MMPVWIYSQEDELVLVSSKKKIGIGAGTLLPPSGVYPDKSAAIKFSREKKVQTSRSTTLWRDDFKIFSLLLSVCWQLIHERAAVTVLRINRIFSEVNISFNHGDCLGLKK